MPVTHVRGTPDDVAGSNGLHGAAFDPRPAATFNDHQALPQWMLVPGGARAWLEPHQRRAYL